MINGVYVGSCAYDDLCSIFKTHLELTPESCTEFFNNLGYDCSCPFRLYDSQIDLDSSIDLPDLSTSSNFIFSAFSTGDFDITINLYDYVGFYTCINVKYSIRKAFF